MKKIFWKKGWLLPVLILFIAAGAVLAKPAASKSVKSGEIVSGDKFIFAQMFRNDGTIKGDLFFWAQDLSSTGTVEGDIIGGGQNVNVSGKVLGNIRAIGGSVNLTANVAKNVNVCGATVALAEGSALGGSLIACGRDIIISGRVKGNTLLYGSKITLNGEFFGDVAINYFEMGKHDVSGHISKASLTVLPGTIVHGKLKFKGGAADIQQGAKVADFQWIKSKIPPDEKIAKETKKHIWSFVRLVLTTAVYFLIGLLLFKLFPAAFGRLEEFSVEKPWNAIAYGLIVLFSTIAAAVMCIVLLAMSFFISPAFGLIFGLAAAGIYVLLFYFSTLPVALLLGRLLAKEKLSMVLRLALGLILFNLVIFVLGLLGNVPVIGPVFPGLAFIIRFGAALLGIGALAYTVKGIFAASKNA